MQRSKMEKYYAWQKRAPPPPEQFNINGIYIDQWVLIPCLFGKRKVYYNMPQKQSDCEADIGVYVHVYLHGC